MAKINDATASQFRSVEESLSKDVKNKIRRAQLFGQLKIHKSKAKSTRRQERKRLEESLGANAPKREVPKTLDNQRDGDTTLVDADDDEVIADEDDDELAPYFQRAYTPKICITTSDKARRRSITFCRELMTLLPNSKFYKRCSISLKKLVVQAKERGFSDLIVVNEDRGLPNGLILTHLPDGPTAYFKLTSVKLQSEIKRVGASVGKHEPELILSNFTTRLGHSVARMFAALLPHDPNFQGRRAVTIHNQRDFIFLRNHRYIFRSNERVGLQELGPRATLKLQWLQKGTFDNQFGDFIWQWKRRDMETSRRKFYL